MQARSYIIQYCDVTEVKNNKAPLYVWYIVANNLKEAKITAAAQQAPFGHYLLISVVPDKGQKVSKRAKHTLTPYQAKKAQALLHKWQANTEDAMVDVGEWEPLQVEPELDPIPAPESGPESPATVAVVADLNGMLNHDAHEALMDTFEKFQTTDEPHEFPPIPYPYPDPVDAPKEIKVYDYDSLCGKDSPLESPAPKSLPCPSATPCPCGMGTDDNGDGDCAACTSPVMKQMDETKVAASKPSLLSHVPFFIQVIGIVALGVIAITLLIQYIFPQ